MRKIIFLALIIFLGSCANNNISEEKENVVIEKKQKIESKNIEGDKENINDEINFGTIEKNLSKLKNIDLNEFELERLNNDIKNIFKQSIYEKALNSKDITICNQLEESEQNFCKSDITTRVAIENNDLKGCNTLTNTGSSINCKNDFYNNLAEKELDEKVCEKIADDSEDKFKINNCKTKILMDKAIKNLNIGSCNKITNPERKRVCQEIVRIEKEIKIEKIPSIETIQ